MVIDHAALVRDNDGWIRKCAKRYARRHYDEDVLQEARIGFLRALQTFDASRAKLTTYSEAWIRHFVRRYIDNFSTTVRVPVHTRARASAGLSPADAYALECMSEPADVDALVANESHTDKLATLDAQEVEVLVRLYVDEMPPLEVAMWAGCRSPLETADAAIRKIEARR